MYPWRTPGGGELKAYVPGWDPTDLDYDDLTLDLSHASTANQQSIDLVRSWGSRLRHVHLTDGTGSAKDEHLVPGRGDQQAGRVLQYLAERNFSGHVVLEACSGSDLAIVNSARVSFDQESTEFGERERGLINFLMRERHGTPFEAPTFRFDVRAPIFVIREHFRHRVGHSYNEESGRYSKIKTDFYVPERDAVRVGRHRSVELWSSPLLLLAGVALLTAEWYLRRRAGHS